MFPSYNDQPHEQEPKLIPRLNVFLSRCHIRAIVFLGPRPLKKALALDDLFDPSITKIFFKE